MTPRRALEAVEGKRTKFATSALLSFECTGRGCPGSPGKTTRKTIPRVVVRLRGTVMRQLHRQELYGGVLQERGRSKGVAGIDGQDSMPLQNRKTRDDGE